MTRAAPAVPSDGLVTRRSRELPIVCFLSGAAGLIFEIVWFHRSGLVFGSIVWATTLVLSSFMGGLTVGGAIVAACGHRVRRLLGAYAAAEALVAMSGVALTYALPGLTHAAAMLTRPTGEHIWITNAVR